ncbi:radical SAM family heme chaperone HemW [Thermodesulfobacterium hydrogeniphilum]|uniref:radical SAM family heme chaperone HemW n=1 Tax=Thermodesulfobacterium hydrogeniphilum TaxID=161156 RepID=UPI00056F0926|nr:radical SAM family heme chaperone HemW [Thermodesulfobacterium hydrogeniphilum]
MIKIGLYLHIPFCLRKCPYCDFYSIPIKFNRNFEENYLKAIKKELVLIKNFLSKKIQIKDFSFITFYAGGGTPSLLSPDFYENLFNFLDNNFNFSPAELTLEANPETLTLEKLKNFRKIGINRLSLGVQSFSQKGLKFLGRLHTVRDIVKSINWISKANFSNFSLDFIFGWKGQGEKTLKKEILKALEFDPPHFSFYELTIEKNTPFYHLYKEKSWFKDKKSEKFYQIIEDTLSSYGYDRYEISNYAFSGFECKHNLIYWEVKPYLGLGPSAVSRISYLRWENPPDLNLYINNLLKKNKLPFKILEKLDNFEFAKEYIFMGLRLKKGISLEILKNKYKTKIKTEIIDRLIYEGLLSKTKDRIYLTFRGKLLYNRIVLLLWENLICV